jgi:hypothetical protein
MSVSLRKKALAPERSSDMIHHSSHRFERKFVFEHLHPGVVEMWIKQNPALFRTAYPARFVNNVYFDSPDFHAYQQNKEGVPQRTKIRVRWYGPRLGRIEAPVLEFKKKQGSVGTKDSYPLPAFELSSALSLNGLLAAISAAPLPTNAHHLIAGVQPALLNRYHRQYYVSADGQFRLTLDSSLEYYRVARAGNGSQLPHGKPRLIVLELKYPNEAALETHHLSQTFATRVTRLSKYVTGIDGLYGR